MPHAAGDNLSAGTRGSGDGAVDGSVAGAGKPGRRLIAGLDGGGTKTECLLHDPSSGFLGWSRTGPLNVNYVSPEHAAQNVASAISEAAAAADCDAAELGSLVVAAPWSEELVAEVARRTAPKVRIEAAGEDRTALMGGWLRPTGLVLTAGTGSRCAWIPDNTAEQPIVIGAWGSLFGDEGSGYDIGSQALRAATKHWDGRGPATALAELIREAWHLRRPKDVVRLVYGPPAGAWRGRVAALCPLVGQAAAGGDGVALAILDGAAGCLAELVAATTRLAALPEPHRILVTDGVFRLGQLLLSPLRGQLTGYGRVEVVLPELAPVYGALLLAATLDTGLPPDAELVGICRRHYRERQRGHRPGIVYNGPSEEG